MKRCFLRMQNQKSVCSFLKTSNTIGYATKMWTGHLFRIAYAHSLQVLLPENRAAQCFHIVNTYARKIHHFICIRTSMGLFLIDYVDYILETRWKKSWSFILAVLLLQDFDKALQQVGKINSVADICHHVCDYYNDLQLNNSNSFDWAPFRLERSKHSSCNGNSYQQQKYHIWNYPELLTSQLCNAKTDCNMVLSGQWHLVK